MKTVYQFKPQSRLKGDPQKVGEEIEAMISSHGTIGPRDVVQQARAESSVLHRYFCWDDSVAAEKFRETQAAHLLRSIVAVRSTAIDIDQPVRGFVPITAAIETEGRQLDQDEPPARYVTIASAVRVVDYRMQLMESAVRDLDAYRIKYQLLADITGWRSAIAKARTVLDTALQHAQGSARQ